MKQYSFKVGAESAVPVYKRKTVANLNRARSALIRCAFSLGEAREWFEQEGDHVALLQIKRIGGQIRELRGWVDDRQTTD